MIRLIVVDIDGCLTAGEGRPLDFRSLAKIARFNSRARTDPRTPAVTLCSGRPAPYVEVMHQAIGGHVPALYEHGCGMLVPEHYGFRTHPSLQGVAQDEFRAAIKLVRERLVGTGRAYFQPGKEHSASLYPIGGSVDDLFAATRDLLGPRLQ